MLTMAQVKLANQRVLIREDFNVPIKQGKILHAARIKAALPTLKTALSAKAKVLVMSHLGRPTGDDHAYSLQPVADYLSQSLGQKVTLFSLANVPKLKSGEIALLENVRFLKGEEQNSPTLAKQLAALCDVFVMDAFAVAHRAHASTHGVASFAPIACAGPLLLKELQVLDQLLENPQHPVLAIVGGSKVSTKLKVLTHLLDKVDVLALGGGIANTFLAALDLPVGNSLQEKELIPVAQALLQKAQHSGKTIWLPQDVVVEVSQSVSVKACRDVKAGDKIFDIGPQSQQDLAQYIARARTILWNGPVGVCENPSFAKGSESIAKAISTSQAFSVAGGGDTLAAIEQFGVTPYISYLSTGGGAFLEMLEGKMLPGVEVLFSAGAKKE